LLRRFDSMLIEQGRRGIRLREHGFHSMD
jgi:hypothetical protein